MSMQKLYQNFYKQWLSIEVTHTNTSHLALLIAAFFSSPKIFQFTQSSLTTNTKNFYMLENEPEILRINKQVPSHKEISYKNVLDVKVSIVVFSFVSFS